MFSKNFTTNLYLGSFLILVSLIDVTLNSFFKLNFTNFLPGSISFFLPLILGTIGLYLIRSDYTGLKQLDILNKNVNTSNFNAVLTLLIIFLIIKAIPPSMSWMILDANISGDSREACTGTGACWTYIKVWFKRFMYGMYPNELHWRINAAFILVIVLGMAGLLATEKLKKYFALYYVCLLYTSPSPRD